MSILRCAGDTVLDPRCAWHAGLSLLWCTEHDAHGCPCMLRAAFQGLLPDAPPPRTVPSDWPGPRFVVFAAGVSTWATGGVPIFVTDMRARLSGASEYMVLVHRGLS